MTKFLPVSLPYSDSHVTSVSSTFSSFMVKMLWLRGGLASDLPIKEKLEEKKTTKQKKTCLLLEDWFIFVAAACLFLFPQ